MVSLCGTCASEGGGNNEHGYGPRNYPWCGSKVQSAPKRVACLGHMGQCSKFIINHKSSYFFSTY